MKIGIICIHRGDRANFLAQFKKYMAAQTMQPDHVEYVDYPPESGEIDITQRYRRGYEKCERADLLLFCEIDDFYGPTYVEKMVAGWIEAGKPQLFGIASSVYYHIAGKWFSIDRPSMNGMAIRGGMHIDWPWDNYPYCDVVLCTQFNLVTMPMPATPIVVGIKHGIGLVGGGSHDAGNERYVNGDESGEWLRGVVGECNMGFYYHMRIQQGITKAV